MVLENHSVQNSHMRYFGSPMSSDSNALNSYTFKVTYMSHCQNSSKFLSVSYLMKTADVIMNFSSSRNTTNHT